MIKSPDVVCASPRPLDARSLAGGQLGSWRRPYGLPPVSHYRTHIAAAVAVVLECHPPAFPGMMDVTGTDLAEVPSASRAGVAAEVPPEREQSFGGGGGDLLSLICPELGVTPQVDPGTDVEDELSIPATPPADVNHAVVSLSVRAEMDNELEQVFVDVGSLPMMVTPVCDPDGAISHDSGGVSCDCGTWRVVMCDSAIAGFLPGWAGCRVSGNFSSIDGVDG